MIRKSRNRLSEKIMLQKNAVKPRVQRQRFCFKRASAARIGATEPYLCCVALKPSRYGPYSLFASRFSGKVRLLGRRRNKTPALSAGDVHAARKLRRYFRLWSPPACVRDRALDAFNFPAPRSD